MDYPSVSRSKKEHLPRLDVVRAVAILLVMSFHFGARDPQFIVHWAGNRLDYGNWPIASWPLLWMNWGWLGVALFFVLSGFCIHLSFLHQSRPFTVREFYLRRFLRIYPAYFLCLILCFALMPWLPSPYKHFYQLPAHLFLVHNLVKCTFLGVNGVFWSLGVECQFYLLYPLLLWLRERLEITGCLLLALGLNLSFQCYFCATRTIIDSPISSIWGFPLVTWCTWVLGACLAEAFVDGRRVFRHNGLLSMISLGVLLAALNYKPLSVQSFLFAAIFCATLIERYLHWTNAPGRLERALMPVGLISYSIYLWHMPIFNLLLNLGAALHLPFTRATQVGLYLPVFILLTALVSWLSYRWIELAVPRAVQQWRRSRPTTEIPPSA